MHALRRPGLVTREGGTAMPKAVCQGAMCTCPVGSAPSVLRVQSQQIVKIGGMLVATIQDCKPVVNLPPFGTCQTLTASASGVPTPCAMAPAGTWMPGSLVHKINNMPVLTDASKLTCGIGGVISISNPSNVIEETK
jgi:hypothetical protein